MFCTDALKNVLVFLGVKATQRIPTDNAQTESVVVIKIVARASAKRAKTEQIQKTEILAIFRLEEGFS